MKSADVHTLSGAYALHALPEDERIAFERHVTECESCRTETREFGEVAARLGLAATVTPPPELKRVVMQRIGTVRQEGPRSAARPDPAVRPSAGRRLSRWALAACLAAATALGGSAVWQHQEAEQARDRVESLRGHLDRLATVLAAPDATSRTTGLPNGARATVVTSRERDKAVFIGTDMARPPSGKVYQLWFDDGGTMRSGGLMDPDRVTESVLMAGPLGDSTGMGITVEPAGGSKEPTSAPVALIGFG